MPKVEFEREGITVEASAGQTVLAVAEAAGVDVFRGIWRDLRCRRRTGWCGRCKVWVKPATPDAVSPPTPKERARLGDLRRLACQATVLGDVAVHTRAGGPSVRAHGEWPPGAESERLRLRWEHRHDGKPAKPEAKSDVESDQPAKVDAAAKPDGSAGT